MNVYVTDLVPGHRGPCGVRLSVGISNPGESLLELA